MTSHREPCLPRANRRTWQEQRSRIVFVHLCLATCRSGWRPKWLPDCVLQGAWSSFRSAVPNYSRADPRGGHLPWTPYSSSEPFSLSKAAIWRVEGMHRQKCPGGSGDNNAEVEHMILSKQVLLPVEKCCITRHISCRGHVETISYQLLYTEMFVFVLMCIILPFLRRQKWMEVAQQLSALEHIMAPHNHTVRLWILNSVHHKSAVLKIHFTFFFHVKGSFEFHEMWYKAE